MNDERTPEDAQDEENDVQEQEMPGTQPDPDNDETSEGEASAEDREAAITTQEPAPEATAPPGQRERIGSPADEDVSKRSTPVALIALIVLAVIAIGAWAAMMLIRPEPRELLEQSLAKYAEADQIHVESSLSYEMAMGEEQDSATLLTTAWFSRPDQMFFETGDETSRTAAISDGENLYLSIDFGMFPGTIKLPAPESLAGMPLDRLSVSAATGMQDLILPDIASIISGAFSLEEIGDIQHGIADGNDWLSSLEHPDNTWVLTLRTEMMPAIAVWIGRSDRLVHKYAARVDYAAIVAATPQIEQQIETLPEERQEAIRQMETRLVGDVQTVELNRTAPEGTFAFQPAEGTEIVEAMTIDEGIQKLISTMMGQEGMPQPPPPGEAPDVDAPIEE